MRSDSINFGELGLIAGVLWCVLLAAGMWAAFALACQVVTVARVRAVAVAVFVWQHAREQAGDAVAAGVFEVLGLPRVA